MSLTDERRSQIALAVLKSRVLRDGIHLKPQDIRSEVGNKVNELNELDHNLGLTTEEAYEFMKELVDFANEAAFRPSKRQERRKTKKSVPGSNWTK